MVIIKIIFKVTLVAKKLITAAGRFGERGIIVTISKNALLIFNLMWSDFGVYATETSPLNLMIKPKILTT